MRRRAKGGARYGYEIKTDKLLCIIAAAAAAAKSLQACPTLRHPIDGNSAGSPVPGILQARTLEWVAMSFSNASKWKVKVKLLSRVQLLVTPWTAAYQRWCKFDQMETAAYISQEKHSPLLFYQKNTELCSMILIWDKWHSKKKPINIFFCLLGIK